MHAPDDATDDATDDAVTDFTGDLDVNVRRLIGEALLPGIKPSFHPRERVGFRSVQDLHFNGDLAHLSLDNSKVQDATCSSLETCSRRLLRPQLKIPEEKLNQILSRAGRQKTAPARHPR